MSLLRLLTAGRSLMGLKGAARYRDLGPKALPKFPARQSPFRRSADPVPAAAAAQPVPVVTAAESKAIAVGKPGEPKTAGWSRWFSRWRRPQSSAIPRFDKALVQAELSLDQVKVMRNDLSDSDLEVVPVRAPVTKAQPGKRAQQARPAAELERGAAEPNLIEAK